MTMTMIMTMMMMMMMVMLQDRRGTRSSFSLGGGGSSFQSGHTDSQGRHSHGPRERSNSVISTFSSRMGQFGPSRDYPYSYPGEFSETDEETEESEDKKEEEEEAEEKKEEETEPEPQPEPKENVESESKSCDCTHKKEESVEKEVKKEPEVVEVIDSPKEDTHLKKNPIKSIIETKKIIRENHISSRFY